MTLRKSICQACKYKRKWEYNLQHSPNVDFTLEWKLSGSSRKLARYFSLHFQIKNKSNLFHSHGNKDYIGRKSASKKSLKMQTHGRANFVQMAVTDVSFSTFSSWMFSYILRNKSNSLPQGTYGYSWVMFVII